MDFPITLYTEQYYIVFTVKSNLYNAELDYLSWGITGVSLDFIFTLYKNDNTKIGENKFTLNV
jgi:hypothetical protein